MKFADNQYYIAYTDNTDGLSGGEPPFVYYGNVTSSGSNPPVPGFQDASKVAIPGVGGDAHLCHQAAAVLGGAPYIFQFTCTRNGAPTLLSANYEKMIAPVISGTAPTFTTAGNVSSSIVSAMGNVFDVAAATLNSKVYVFVLRGNGSNPDSISVLSYGGQGSGGPVLESSYTFAGTNSNIQIQSIDATNVTLASGEQAIVVCSPFVGSGQAQVKVWLFTGNSGGQAVTINPYSLANPSYANYPAAIRMAYGPAQGTQKVNSVTLFMLRSTGTSPGSPAGFIQRNWRSPRRWNLEA